MDLSTLNTNKHKTYQEWNDFIGTLQTESARTQMVADAIKKNYTEQAVKFAESWLAANGFKPHTKLVVLPEYSTEIEYGVEFLGCEWAEYQDGVVLNVWVLLKSGKRSAVGPSCFGLVRDYAKHVALAKS